MVGAVGGSRAGRRGSGTRCNWLSEFNPLHDVNTASTFATVSYRDEKLFVALAIASEWRLSELKWTGGYQNGVDNCATEHHQDEQSFTTFAVASKRRLSEFDGRGCHHGLDVCAAAHNQDEKSDTNCAIASERQLSEFNGHGVANTAWAFAGVNL